jgi:hypothetical protein
MTSCVGGFATGTSFASEFRDMQPNGDTLPDVEVNPARKKLRHHTDISIRILALLFHITKLHA